MARQSRRNFLTTASVLTLGTAVSAAPMTKKSNVLFHHVFFWLKNPASTPDRDKLIEGLRTLKQIKGVHDLHIGTPADTEKRPVVDSSYQVTELIFFDSVEEQKLYQDDPIHKKFVEIYSPLWEKVVVYDSLRVD